MDGAGNWDVCIVGSGVAGTILAVSLAKAGKKVLIIEAGGNVPDYAIENFVNTTQVSGDTDLRFGFTRQVGGATNLWAGRLTPLEAIDFELRAEIPESGWPISREDLIPYYNRASDILGLRNVGDFNSAISWPEEFVRVQDIEIKKFLWAHKPFNAADYISEALKNFSNLKLMTGFQAVKIITDGDRVSGIRVAFADGNVAKTIDAQNFVIAAGGIETPRLLMHSGLGGEAVGCYFSTHPKADMAVLKLNKRVAINHPLFIDTQLGEGMWRGGIGISKDVLMQSGGINHYVQLSPMVEYKASKLFERIKGSSLMKSKFFDGSEILKGIVPTLGLFIYDIIGRISGWQKKCSLFVLRGFLDQHPNRDNRITLSNVRDKFGVPLVDIKWEFTQRDRESVINFFEVLDKQFRQARLGHIEFAKMKYMQDWPLIGIHSHFMGATRMGNDRKTSVTDKNAQVYGLSNLFIAGPSLFPTYGYANPVYTITALSLRLADYLSARINEK